MVNLRMKIGLPYALFGLMLLLFLSINYYLINFRLADMIERKGTVERIHGNTHMISEIAKHSILTSDSDYLAEATQIFHEVHSLLERLEEVDLPLGRSISDDFTDFYDQTVDLSSLFLEGREQSGTAILDELERLQQRMYSSLHSHMQEVDEDYAATVRLSNLLILSTSGIFGLILILVLLYIIPHHILNPLREPIKFAKDVASGNLQAVPPSVRSKDEVGTLSNALGEMHSTHIIMNSLLRLSLENEPLEVLLQKAIDRITSLSWLDDQGKGAIFLSEEPGVLTMKAECGLPDPVRKLCSRVPFGLCICGRAAILGECHHTATTGGDHDISYEGIVPHGHYCVPIQSSQKVMIGVLNIYTDPGTPYNKRQEDYLRAVANLLAGIIERSRAKETLQRSIEQRSRMTENAVEALASVVELRDPYTAGHQRRVAQLSVAIAKSFGLDEARLATLKLASLVHDVGKVHVPSEILNRPGKLSELEIRIVREHAKVGWELFKEVEFAQPIAEIIYQHHERLDGSGYPRGLKEDEILLEAKILAIADVVEAMSSHRPYRQALGIDSALTEIAKNAGLLYDNDLVNSCLKLFEEGFTFREEQSAWNNT